MKKKTDIARCVMGYFEGYDNLPTNFNPVDVEVILHSCSLITESIKEDTGMHITPVCTFGHVIYPNCTSEIGEPIVYLEFTRNPNFSKSRKWKRLVKEYVTALALNFKQHNVTLTFSKEEYNYFNFVK